MTWNGLEGLENNLKYSKKVKCNGRTDGRTDGSTLTNNGNTKNRVVESRERDQKKKNLQIPCKRDGNDGGLRSSLLGGADGDPLFFALIHPVDGSMSTSLKPKSKSFDDIFHVGLVDFLF